MCFHTCAFRSLFFFFLPANQQNKSPVTVLSLRYLNVHLWPVLHPHKCSQLNVDVVLTVHKSWDIQGSFTPPEIQALINIHFAAMQNSGTSASRLTVVLLFCLFHFTAFIIKSNHYSVALKSCSSFAAAAHTSQYKSLAAVMRSFKYFTHLAHFSSLL